MNITIVSFEVFKEIPKENKKRFFKKKQKLQTYNISLEYNIDEDRFYYNDETKCIPTKKDLSRSLMIIYDIYKRYEKFNLKKYFTLKVDNLEMFLNQFFNSNNTENEYYYQKMIFGSKPINLFVINMICEELEIGGDIDFNDYYYFNYRKIDIC